MTMINMDILPVYKHVLRVVASLLLSYLSLCKN